ncbi:hypothetical protein HanPI659440_Chr02g0034721 [Helianthus annuus]|nr:hypothetical protein HanPI659440_Chr02g0034721 [Helianthus annuus]
MGVFWAILIIECFGSLLGGILVILLGCKHYLNISFVFSIRMNIKLYAMMIHQAMCG